MQGLVAWLRQNAELKGTRRKAFVVLFLLMHPGLLERIRGSRSIDQLHYEAGSKYLYNIRALEDRALVRNFKDTEKLLAVYARWERHT